MSLWTVPTTLERLAALRESLDLTPGGPFEYVGTPDGGITLVVAQTVRDVDEGFDLALQQQFIASAAQETLIARARERLQPARAGTYSRYTVRVDGAGTIALGDRFRGGGPLGRSLWAVVTASATYADDDTIEVEAEEVGPITLTSPATLAPVSPITGIDGLTYDSGDSDPFAVGTDPESTPELRARLLRPVAALGSPPGLRDALELLSWVVRADVRAGVAVGSLAVTVGPGPVGDDQEAELAQAIYDNAPVTTSSFEGSTSANAVDVNGSTVPIGYTAGTDEAVATVVTITGDGSVSVSTLEALFRAAIQSEYAELGPGDPIRRIRLNGAMDIPGATAVVLSLNGSTTAASVSPSLAANTLVPSPLTVTASIA